MWLQKNAATNRAELSKGGGAGAAFAKMNTQKPEVEGVYFQPGGRLGDAHAKLVMQVCVHGHW